MTERPSFSLLVVQPDDECPPERFGPWLEEAGARLHIVRPFAGDVLPERVDADGLLVLGGSMGANDDECFQWLTRARTLMRNAVEDNVPTLGICLGAQILATAMGGTVERGAVGMESGVIKLTALAEAESDNLVGQLRWPIQQGTMHRDAVVKLPAGAVRLASSEDYPHQAFRLGRYAWGLQFHPELSPELYRRWAAHLRQEEPTIDQIRASIAHFEESDGRVRPAARAMAHAFASVVVMSMAHAHGRSTRSARVDGS